jgi:hypothetical protein
MKIPSNDFVMNGNIVLRKKNKLFHCNRMILFLPNLMAPILSSCFNSLEITSLDVLRS